MSALNTRPVVIVVALRSAQSIPERDGGLFQYFQPPNLSQANGFPITPSKLTSWRNVSPFQTLHGILMRSPIFLSTITGQNFLIVILIPISVPPGQKWVSQSLCGGKPLGTVQTEKLCDQIKSIIDSFNMFLCFFCCRARVVRSVKVWIERKD